MRIKNTLILVILLFSIIPMIFISVLGENNIKKVEKLSVIRTIETSTNQQNSVIDNFFNKCESNSNRLKSACNFENLIKLNTEFSIKRISKNEYEKQKNEYVNDLNAALSFDRNIDNIIVLDNNNNFITSTKQFDNNLLSRFFVEKSVSFNGNYSEFFIPNKTVNDFPSFAYLSIIKGSNGDVGKLVIIYNLQSIQNSLKNVNLYDNMSTFICDFKGNVFEFPFTSITNYSQMSKYSKINNLIKSTINDNSNQLKSVAFKTNNADNIAYAKHLSALNGTLVSVTDLTAIGAKAISKSVVMPLAYILIIIIIVVLCIIYVNQFTKPITYIMLALKNKQQGDKFAEFSVNCNNEFADMNNAFNEMIEDLSEKEKTYRTVIEMNDNIIFEYSINDDIVRYSNNFKKFFSYRAKNEKYENSFIVNCQLHLDDISQYENFIKNAFTKKSSIQGEFRFKTIYGDYMWFFIKATLLYDNKEKPYKIIGAMVDIDNAKKSKLKLLQRAEYDALTKLFNRETFEKQLANEYSLSRMRKQSYAVLFIDIDDFKHYNDAYGHACGDEVLKFIGSTIKKSIESRGFAGRYGGDEFVICICAQDKDEDIFDYCKELISALKDGFLSKVVVKNISINCSIGISFFSENGNNLETIVDEADEAMYKVKKHGKSNFAVYNKI